MKDTLTSYDGTAIPKAGFGTWNLTETEINNSLSAAINIGYRHIDCAAIYMNESFIGNALTEIFQTGLITRDELFITSKLWNSEHHPENVRAALLKTLTDLKLEYLDLYLIHWPVAWTHNLNFPKKQADLIPLSELPILDTWLELEKLKNEGLIRAIGVSNFNIPKLKNLLEAGNIRPCVNQIEHHPYLQQQQLLDYCQSNGIIITGYSPLGSPSTQKGNKKIKLMDNPSILSLAKEYSSTPADILLRWASSKNIALIPKSATPERLKDNYFSLKKSLQAEHIQQIDKLNINLRYTDGKDWYQHGDSYSSKSIWED